jgi:hypothetical protein
MASGELPSNVIATTNFVGRGPGGQVKALEGFKKGHHTIPDAANAVTNAFLGKICERELKDEAEKLFQAIRAGLDYKRKDLSLSVTTPLATLTAKDFTVEIAYALEEREPARYAVTTTMTGLKRVELARTEAFARIFAERFVELSFALKKGAQVESVIDAIENLDAEGDRRLTVDYPSDYRHCVIRVDGVDAEVRCTSDTLDIVFPRAGSPVELIDAFVAVRDAFQISKALSGLIE